MKEELQGKLVETEPKFCRDCKYYQPSDPYAQTGNGLAATGRNTQAECKHPNNTKHNLVTGIEVTKAAPQELRQYAGGSCSQEGNWFEAKPPKSAPEPVAQAPWPYPEPEQPRSFWRRFLDGFLGR